MASFVKFSRGLLQTYNSLTRKDPDTLYLVYENVNSATGSLYLGNKLISSVNSGVAATSLADLTDVSLNGNLPDGVLLQYNSSTGNGVWEAVSLSDILPAGLNNDISFEESLDDIESPSEKDIAIIDNNVYIYNGEEWVQLTNSDLEDRISALETKVGQPANAQEEIPATGLYAELEQIQSSLNNVYTKAETNSYISQQIANAQHLKYEIVNSVEDIDVEADAAEYTIYLVPKAETEEDNGYDEYFVIDENIEKIGEWGVDLSNYVTTDDERLNAITLDENDNLTITTSQVSDLAQAIQSNQLIQSVASGVFEVDENNELQLVGIPSNLLDNYVTTTTFNNKVGDLSLITNRVSPNSSIVEEINSIKASITWRAISGETEE